MSFASSFLQCLVHCGDHCRSACQPMYHKSICTRFIMFGISGILRVADLHRVQVWASSMALIGVSLAITLLSIASRSQESQKLSARMLKNYAMVEIQLTIATVNKRLDFICFSAIDSQPHLPLCTRAIEDMTPGQEFALCSYQLHLGSNVLKEKFDPGLAPFTVSLINVASTRQAFYLVL